jgi:hypothetical protein
LFINPKTYSFHNSSASKEQDKAHPIVSDVERALLSQRLGEYQDGKEEDVVPEEEDNKENEQIKDIEDKATDEDEPEVQGLEVVGNAAKIHQSDKKEPQSEDAAEPLDGNQGTENADTDDDLGGTTGQHKAAAANDKDIEGGEVKGEKDDEDKEESKGGEDKKKKDDDDDDKDDDKDKKKKKEQKKQPKDIVKEDYIQINRITPFIDDFEFGYELNPVIRKFTLNNDSPFSVNVSLQVYPKTNDFLNFRIPSSQITTVVRPKSKSCILSIMKIYPDMAWGDYDLYCQVT